MSYQAEGAFITTSKHGARIQFSFESFINDEWNVVARFPKDAATLAARTEDLLVLLQIFDPVTRSLRADVFNDANKTKADFTAVPDEFTGGAGAGGVGGVKNAALSFDAIVAARYQALATIRDGHSTYVPEGFVLVTNPALAEVAKSYTLINEIRTPGWASARRSRANPLKGSGRCFPLTSSRLSVVRRRGSSFRGWSR